VYPWRATAVHLPAEADFARLRAARNRLLITDDEQIQLRAGAVAVAGLSIGLAVVMGLVLTVAPCFLRIADFDKLSLPNLNRMAASVCELGMSKTTIAARRATELDPFVTVCAFHEGVTDDNLDRLLVGPPRIDLLIEEMDDIRMKVQARFAARRLLCQ
jgi:tRNA A37 threonylcarbamoyladenosine dehydratase